MASSDHRLHSFFRLRWGLLLIFCLLAGHVVYWTDMRMRAPDHAGCGNPGGRRATLLQITRQLNAKK